MSGKVPPNRPKADADLIRRLAYSKTEIKEGVAPSFSDSVPAVHEKYKLCLLFVRGYYNDSMGKPKVNDAGDYDDAAFVITPDEVFNFNANTDPSVVGWNPALGKPYAMLDVGVWYFIKGLHKGAYQALRQPDEDQAEKFGIPNHGHFTVIRDNGKTGAKHDRYADTGYHAINIHRAGINGTSSWGCLTIPPAQYTEFMIKRIYTLMEKYKQNVMATKLIIGPIT